MTRGSQQGAPTVKGAQGARETNTAAGAVRSLPVEERSHPEADRNHPAEGGSIRPAEGAAAADEA